MYEPRRNMLNSFRASWRTMSPQFHPPIFGRCGGSLPDYCWLGCGWCWGYMPCFVLVACKKSATDHSERIYLYSKAVRLWHWSNALLFVLLLASGLINHFALVGATAVKSLVAVHEVCGFLLLACWLGFVLINAVGGNGHHYRIRRQGWLDRAAKQRDFICLALCRGKNILSRQQPSLNLIPYSRSPMLVSCMDCCHCYY